MPPRNEPQQTDTNRNDMAVALTVAITVALLLLIIQLKVLLAMLATLTAIATLLILHVCKRALQSQVIIITTIICLYYIL